MNKGIYRLKTTKIFADNWILIIILISSAVVRYWGIGFGLPNINCRPDESIIVRTALRFGTGDLNPHFFNYPSLYMYVIFAIYGFYFTAGRILGIYRDRIDFLTEYTLDPSNFYLIDRLFTALLGTVSVFILYKIVRSLFDKKTALLSSAFLGFAYLHVRDSHFGVTDIPMTFLILCSILFISKSRNISLLKNYVIAGIFAGLAAATKYGGILLFVPMILTHYFIIKDENSANINSFFDKRLVSFMLTIFMFFIIGSPYILLDFDQFSIDFLSESDHFSSGM